MLPWAFTVAESPCTATAEASTLPAERLHVALVEQAHGRLERGAARVHAAGQRLPAPTTSDRASFVMSRQAPSKFDMTTSWANAL